MKLLKTILLWIIGILFILTGLSKMFGLDEMSKEIFRRAHFPDVLFYLVAFLELLGGVFLILRKYRRQGAVIIAAVMIGALGTHIYLHDAIGHWVAPFLLAILVPVLATSKG